MDSAFNVDCVKIWGKQEVCSLEKYLKPFRNYEDVLLLYLFVEMEKEHVIEENCMTDELDSGENEDSCDDKLVLIKFNEEEPMTKDFTLRLKWRFSALKQFKKVILQYCVLNGVHVRFAKNDSVRQFFNKSVKDEWVAKMIFDNLENNSKMKLNEVVSNVRDLQVSEEEYLGYEHMFYLRHLCANFKKKLRQITMNNMKLR
ncbi:hypothetical protein KIW84_015434 [Lathyrus oleraceus]|uniref:Uncharacterized protein n=1 Tax=Pisum sativum TaxID=3888 RepID=A0A9D5H0X5_PEA|nr:hypothetical protein KIW84_015434 [Pisum sativum]